MDEPEMLVEQIMTRPVVTVREGVSLQDAARLMLDRSIGGLPVVDSGGRIIGIITESDFTGEMRWVPFSSLKFPNLFDQWLPEERVSEIYRAARHRKVNELMTGDPVTAEPTETVSELIHRMVETGHHRIPVVSSGIPVGMVTRHDLLILMSDSQEQAPS